MKIIYGGENPSFDGGLPDGVSSVGFNHDNKPIFELRDGTPMPVGARVAIDNDLIGLPDVSKLFGKLMAQKAIASQMSGGDKQMLALSLAGKTSNALSGSLNILMQVLGNLAQVQSIDDVRNAVAPSLSLATQVQSLVESGEIMSVQYAQGISDEDAVIEGLRAMTQVATIIKSQQTGGNDG